MKEALKLALEALESNRQNHTYCEDTWYSCPKHEDGCANEAEGDACNCGADEINAQFDKAITAIKEALMSFQNGVQPEPSPEWMTEEEQTAYTFGWFKALESQRMAQPAVAEQHKQEPVAHFGSAYVNENGVHVTTVLGPVAIPQDAKLYTTPYAATPRPHRTPLTELQVRKIASSLRSGFTWFEFAQAIEAAHDIHPTGFKE